MTKYTGSCDFNFAEIGLFSGKPACSVTSSAIYNNSGKLTKSVAQRLFAPGIPLQVATTLYDGSSPLQQLVTYSLDTYGNVTEEDESDFNTCTANPLCPAPTQSTSLPAPAGGWLRKTYTEYAYQINSAMASAHIVNKPSHVLVTNGSGTRGSLTDYGYNSYGNLTNEYRCIFITGSGQLGSSEPVPSASCTSFQQTQYTVDATGQVTQIVEGYGTSAAATTGYKWTGPAGASDSHNGYLTTVTHPNNFTDRYTYFAGTGQVETHIDANSDKTSYDYTDPPNRIKSIVLPATVDGTTGSSASGGTTYTYTDSAGASPLKNSKS